MASLMASVPLPADLASALEYAVGTIIAGSGDRLTASDLRLADGTALAALWQHRRSTDLDLVANRSVFAEVFDAPSRLHLRDGLRTARDEQGAPISRIVVTSRLIGFKYAGVPVSLVPSSSDFVDPVLAGRTVGGTGAGLAKPEAILRGKVVGRLLGRATATDRDGYDIAFALHHHGDTAHRALSGLLDDEEFLRAIRDAAGTTGRGRPLLEPSRPDIAADPWGAVRRAVDRTRALSKGHGR